MNPNPYESPPAIEEGPRVSDEQPRSLWWPKFTILELLVIWAFLGVLFHISQPYNRPPGSELDRWIGIAISVAFVAWTALMMVVLVVAVIVRVAKALAPKSRPPQEG